MGIIVDPNAFKQRAKQEEDIKKLADAVESIMTGGDYALVRSVEFFEDYASFGRRQVRDMGMTSRDMLVAITEGGETSSVLGTAAEALDTGCKVFLLFNNPAKLLCEHLKRSKEIIEDPRVCVLDLYCGPMALAGSTRMQATTSEQLIAGAALETIFDHFAERPTPDYAAEFATVLDELEKSAPAIADYIDFEADIYSKSGKVTYFADEYMLDIFTDTTERSPTFMLPPFKKQADNAPEPWAFVKNPLADTATVWQLNFRRPPRCLAWTIDDYVRMGAAENIQKRPPHISQEDFFAFDVGNAPTPARWQSGHDAAVLIGFAPSPELKQGFEAFAKNAAKQRIVILAPAGDIKVSCAASSLNLMRHMAIKLFLNTVSTGTMVKLGRVSGNWMSWVDCTNKKLLDRGVRLLVEISGCDYRTGCITLFEAMEASSRADGAKEKRSPVQIALDKLGRKDG